MRRLPAARAGAAVVLALVAGGAMGPRDAASQERGPVVTSLTLFAGGLTGLWRSTDWGGKWERVSEGTANGALPETGAVRAVLALVRRVYVAADKGLFLSEDFGQTWKRLGVEGETPVTESVLSVMPSRYPQADPTVFVGTERGLLKSVDGGKTFAPTLLRGTPVTRLEWPGPALIATTGHGVVVSEDGGSTFSSGAGLPAGPPQSLAVSSFFARDPVLFTSVGRAGVYRSRDGARTWEFVGLDGKLVADLVWLGPILYAATDHGLFRSDDAGRTWTAGAGLAARACTRLLFPLAPDSGLEAFLITDQGIVHTADGGAHWQETGLLGDGRLCLATFPPVGREPMRKTK